MTSAPSLTFKIASEPAEFEAIHRLNYKTFVEEIPQHAYNPEERLIDKFHAENTYAICLSGGCLVGMVAGRTNRPFSLDNKLPNLDSHLPPGRRVLEVRLLSVEKEHRTGFVFSRLVGLLAQHVDFLLVSGREYAAGFGKRFGDGEATRHQANSRLPDFTNHAVAI